MENLHSIVRPAGCESHRFMNLLAGLNPESKYTYKMSSCPFFLIRSHFVLKWPQTWRWWAGAGAHPPMIAHRLSVLSMVLPWYKLCQSRQTDEKQPAFHQEKSAVLIFLFVCLTFNVKMPPSSDKTCSLGYVQ